MKIVEINSGNEGSTGNVMLGIAKVARSEGDIVYTFGPRNRRQRKHVREHTFFGCYLERKPSAILNTIFGTEGSLNIISTFCLLKQIDNLSPDIIHLHNLHTNYINVQMLFDYIKRKNIRTIWTLHDCISFTGHCPNFIVSECNKWKSGCYACPSYKEYPKSLVDTSKKMWERRKKLSDQIENLTIVVPSQWLGNLVKQSFLKMHSVYLINNGIDLSIFYPRIGTFRKKYALEKKFVILAVAFNWGYLKGLDRIENLAAKLDDRFQLVVVGIAKNQIISKNIISIERTYNQEELAEIYSESDVLFNPTREDNFPTVNLEALACGTPILSYGAGGSAEAFDDTCGLVVNDDNVCTVLDKLYIKNFDSVSCIKRSQKYRQEDKFREYVKLYHCANGE